MHFSFLPGEEEKTEPIGDDKHVEDEAPMAATSEGSCQQWTDGSSNAEMVRLMTKVKCFTPPNSKGLCITARNEDLPVPSMIAVTVARALLEPLETVVDSKFNKMSDST